MWLGKEKKYARFSLRTRNRDTAIDKAKKHYHELMEQQLAGKTYFSKTAKQDIEEYLKQRERRTLKLSLSLSDALERSKTHLEHLLNYIGRDTKLKEMERTDCENYLHSRIKTKCSLNVSHTTVAMSRTPSTQPWLGCTGEQNLYRSVYINSTVCIMQRHQ
jgi:hypothetical protein